LKELVQKSSLVCLAISDSAIDSVFKEIQPWILPGAFAVHFSGALSIPGLAAAHPLMTFGPELYSADFYKKIPFAVTGADSLQQVFPFLENPWFALPAEKKAFYHALCVLGGNFPTLLMQKALREFAALGLQAQHVTPYLQKIVENVVNYPDQALTGPIARKDARTLQKNLTSMAGDPFEPVFKSMIQAVDPELYKTITGDL
jgi:predicted short-subunit dehydrogenase-like oxidoreductase (DUF2520 family)